MSATESINQVYYFSSTLQARFQTDRRQTSDAHHRLMGRGHNYESDAYWWSYVVESYGVCR